MRSKLTSLFFLLLSGVLFSQRVANRIEISYVQYPEQPLPETIKNYTVKISNEADYKYVTTDADEKRIELRGFEYLKKNPEADLLIELKITEARYDTSYVRSTVKRKSDNTTSDVWRYKIIGHMTSQWILKDVKNNKILESLLSEKKERTYKSKKSFEEIGLAKEACQKDSVNVGKTLRKLYNNSKKTFLKKVNNKYGTSNKKVKTLVFNGKDKRFDFNDLKQVYQKFESALLKYARNKSVEEVRPDLEICIAAWEKAVKKYKPNTNKDRINDKNVAYIYYGIASSKFMLKEYESIPVYIDKIKKLVGKGFENPKFEEKTINNFEKVVQTQIRVKPPASVTEAEQPKAYTFTETQIQKINRLLAFDIFMNYELVEKHRNLQVMVDYFSGFENLKTKNIKVNSSSAGHKENILYQFNDNQKLQKVEYAVDRDEGSFIRYEYEFVYDKDRITEVKIGGKKKIEFVYDDKGLVNTIKRYSKQAIDEFVFTYADDGKSAAIKRFITVQQKRRPSSRKYFAKWNDEFRLSEFSFDIYFAKNYTYTKNGDVLSFVAANVESSNNKITWQYTYDDKGNWIEKKFMPAVQFTRILE